MILGDFGTSYCKFIDLSSPDRQPYMIASKDLTAEERDLYDRQFRLEGWSQKLVKESRNSITDFAFMALRRDPNSSLG